MEQTRSRTGVAIFRICVAGVGRGGEYSSDEWFVSLCVCLGAVGEFEWSRSCSRCSSRRCLRVNFLISCSDPEAEALFSLRSNDILGDRLRG